MSLSWLAGLTEQKSYWADREKKLSEIAALVGYERQSSFLRRISSETGRHAQ